MRCLCILDINPLLVVLFANIFLHCIGCFFILSMVLFPIQKLLCLIRSVLFLVILVFGFVLFFVFFRFRGLIQAYIAMIYVKQCSSMFSSGSFMFSVLTFRSLNHFEFIFLYGVRDHLQDGLYRVVYSCLLCHKLIDHGCVDLLLASLYIVSLIYGPVFVLLSCS